MQKGNIVDLFFCMTSNNTARVIVTITYLRSQKQEEEEEEGGDGIHHQ